MNKEHRQAVKKAQELRSKIGDLLEAEDVDVGIALAVLCAMSIDCGLRQAEIPPQELINKLVHGICEVYEALEEEKETEDEGEDDGEIISRTTH